MWNSLLSKSPHSTITYNNLNENYDSDIYLNLSENSSIIGNSLSSRGLALETKNFNYLSLIEEMKYNNLEYYLSLTIEDNLVNNKPLGIYVNKMSESISDSDYGQMIFINCTNLIMNDLIDNNKMRVSLYFCENAQIFNNSFSYTSR